jgi:MraZ protein
MSQPTGEYECRLDDKGRIKLPAGLIRQLGPSLPTFVLNKGNENCLELFPKEQWDATTRLINSRLNVYDPKHRDILRYYYRGATEVTADSAERLLIPRTLIDYAHLQKDCIITCFAGRIEIWDKSRYDEKMASPPEGLLESVKDLLAPPSGH